MNINEFDQDLIFFFGAIFGCALCSFLHLLIDHFVLKDIKAENKSLLEENKILLRKNSKLIRFIRER